jgi:hypothetical protein
MRARYKKVIGFEMEKNALPQKFWQRLVWTANH